MNINSDKELVKMALKDANNFILIMDKYKHPLFAFIKRLLKVTDGDAEDILQDVFIKTYQNLNEFDPQLKFSSWIYRITYNQSISFYRKNKKNLQILPLEDNEAILKKLSVEFNTNKKIDENILRERTRETLRKMDKKYREVLILKYLEDKDYTEISNILKKPMGTIATLLSRAKEKFKNLNI